MADSINAQSAMLLKNFRQQQAVLNKAMTSLSTGKRVAQPGDDVAAFQEISELEFSASTEMAKMETAQARLTWYQVSTAYLQSIGDVLGRMSELTIQANSATAQAEDLAILDQGFQQLKKQISEFVDGQGGTESVAATFRGTPLFIGYAPPASIGSDVILPSDEFEDLSLFTGYKRHGFDTLPLLAEAGANQGGPVDVTLSGTARGGTLDTVQLSVDETTINNAFLGMTLEITGGTGAGQSASIVGYDGDTRTVTLEPSLVTAPDSTSTYTITHHTKNYTLPGVGVFNEVSFAEHVWGADADRFDKVSATAGTFRAVTEAERVYRETNAVPDTDLEVYTDEERLARRQLNIFDPEYGNLRDRGNARRMLTQVQAAFEKITFFMQRQDSKAERIRSAFDMSGQRKTLQEQGVSLLGDAEPWAAGADLQEAALSSERMASLASRLNQNLARLNDLVRSGGNQ